MALIMNKFIDIHNHSLPGVDDGAKSIDEAIKNIDYLKTLGITDIVLTSHYIINSKYNVGVEKRNGILNEIKNKNLGVNLYIGNEVFISDAKSLIELLNNKEIITLNGSKYLLLEFPLNQELVYLEEVICDLNEKGLVPIIAHPERYTYFQKDYQKLLKLLEYDILLQCNIGSIVGRHGRGAKKLFKKLLIENKINFLATDFHHVRSDNLYMKAIKKLQKKISSDKYYELTYFNPKLVLENKDIK